MTGTRTARTAFWTRDHTSFHCSLEQILHPAQSIVPRLPAPTERHEVAVHFRCSDTPFCRNPLSRLLYDRFYHAAAAVIHERRRSPVRSILLVHTAATIVGPWAWRRNHRPLQGRPCNAGLCAAHVRALLLRIFPLWRGSPAAVLLAACRPCSHAGRSLLLYTC
jgi:hypothetical protein